MNNNDYKVAISVDQSPEQVFNAINNVPAWWSQNFEGNSEKLNDVFTVRFGETSITIKVVSLVPDREIRWHVIDCHKHWLKDKKEWKDTEMVWEISTENNATSVHFTHIGLVPGIECYKGCEGAWNFYIKESLLKLISEGEGIPESK